MQEPMSTSLGKLSLSEWYQVSNRWARGIDWNIHKMGSKWMIGGELGTGFPLFRTKREAYDTASELVCREAQHRYWREHYAI